MSPPGPPDSSEPGDTRESVVSALSSSPFLGVASRRALSRLAETATVVDYAEGAVLFRQKDLPTVVLVIESGRVRIFNVDAEGKEEELRTLGPGQIVGEMGVLAGHRRTANAVAVEPTRAWSIERGAFIEIFKSEPAVSIEIAKMMAPYLMDDDDVAEDMLFLDLRQRVAKRLCAVARAAGGAQAPATQLKLSLSDIAMMAGGTDSDVSYILSEFETNGLVMHNGNMLNLLKIDELTSIALGL